MFLGNGNGTFRDRVDYGVGVSPQSVVAADLGNGQIDLVVANHDSSNVSILLGNGDGTFQPAQNIDVNFPVGSFDSNPITLAVDDFNNDGRPDLIIQQEALFFEEVVTVLPGNGDGTFQAPISFDAFIATGGLSLTGLTVGDFSGDGNLDFATVDTQESTGVAVFPGNGDGTFGRPRVFPTGGLNPFGVATSDFNGDGRPDLAVANTFSNSVGVRINTGNGTAGPSGSAPRAPGSHALHAQASSAASVTRLVSSLADVNGPKTSSRAIHAIAGSPEAATVANRVIEESPSGSAALAVRLRHQATVDTVFAAVAGLVGNLDATTLG